MQAKKIDEGMEQLRNIARQNKRASQHSKHNSIEEPGATAFNERH